MQTTWRVKMIALLTTLVIALRQLSPGGVELLYSRVTSGQKTAVRSQCNTKKRQWKVGVYCYKWFNSGVWLVYGPWKTDKGKSIRYCDSVGMTGGVWKIIYFTRAA